MKFRTLLIVFFASLTMEIGANLLNLRSIQYFSKPSLMLILIFYFVSASKNLPNQKHLIIAALISSWLGDCVLLFEKQYPSLFIVGLISFLIAHICYVVYFWQMKKLNLNGSKPKLLAVFGVIVYSVAMVSFIIPNAGNLKIPVLIYTSVISIMLISSLNAFDLKSQTFGKICVAGTILFTISDSILAINRFAISIYFSSAFVMLFYAIAQLLITEGAIRNLNASNAERFEKTNHNARDFSNLN